MGFKLAHISDIHLGPLPKVRARELMSKRVTGYINWQRNRARNMGIDTLESVVAGVKSVKPEHVAITGDLINIGLEGEVALAADWLKRNWAPDSTSLVPGNHDAYVRGTLVKAVRAWKPFMSDDRGDPYGDSTYFPYLRKRGDLAIIGTSSAVATPTFVAAGRFDSKQAARLATLLEQTRKQDLFRVILIHHPPVKNAAARHKRLFGIRTFQRVVKQHGAELILHGHTHVPQRHEITRSDGGKIPVIGVPSASQSPGAKRPAGAFNLFQIDRENGKWRCLLEEYSATGGVRSLTVTDKRTLL